MKRHVMITSIAALFCSGILLGSPHAAASGFDESLARARRASHQDAPALALQFYLEAIESFGSATATQRKELAEELLAVCDELLARDADQAALQGLVVLLPLTSSKNIKPRSTAYKVRLRLQNLAMRFVAENQPRQALTALEALMADGEDDPLIWGLMVRAYIEARDFEEADQSLERAFSLHPDAPELLFVRAALAGARSRQAVNRSNFGRAEALLQSAAHDLELAAKKQPRMAGIHRALGKIRSSLWVYYHATGHYEKAMHLLGRAEEAYALAAHLDPHNPEIPFSLGRMLHVAGDWIAAGGWFEESHRRYKRMLAEENGAGPGRRLIERNMERCLRNIVSGLHNRALDAYNTAHFDLARRLVHQAGRRAPGLAPESDKLLAWIKHRQDAFKRRVEKLGSETGSAEAQVELGNLMMRVRRYERAVAAYRRAAGLLPGTPASDEIGDKIYGASDMQDDPRVVELTLGNLPARLEIPGSHDPASLLDLLQRAHARTMAVFPHRLEGPLDLKVFVNRRAFLERIGSRVSATQGGTYVFGRVVTFLHPGRSRSTWLEILTHEMSHRYIDELSYAKTPRWLSEGVALWISREWSPRDELKLRRLAKRGLIVGWDELEERFDRDWNDPVAMNALYLQAQSMVRWLVESFDHTRLIVLLAALRTENPLALTMLQVYGRSAEDLEREWLAGLK